MSDACKDSDAVPWGELTHAYGFAEDVPRQLRSLRSGDQAQRDGALDELSNNLFHQGNLYRATVPALTILCGLVGDPSTPDRLRILDLIETGVLDPTYLPSGYDPNVLRDKAAKINVEKGLIAERSVNEGDIDIHDDDAMNLAGSMTWHWAHQCYLTLERESALFFRLTGDADLRIRRKAAVMLALFPKWAPNSVEALRRHLKETEDPVARFDALVALGLVQRYSKATTDLFERELGQASSPITLLGAALSDATMRGRSGPKVKAVLLEALGQRDALNTIARQTCFNDRDMRGLVCYVLAATASIDKTLIDTIGSCVPLAVAAEQEQWVFAAMLRALFGDAPEGQKRRAHSDLTMLQVAGLKHLLGYKEWHFRDFFASRLVAYGLPETKPDLEGFLRISECGLTR